MATATDFIADVLRILSVISDAETPTAEQVDQHITTLNDMLAMWSAKGAELGYQPVTTGTDTIYLPDWANRPVKMNLAAELSLQYARPLEPRLEAAALEGRQLVAKMTSEDPLVSTLDIPSGRKSWVYNVFTDN